MMPNYAQGWLGIPRDTFGRMNNPMIASSPQGQIGIANLLWSSLLEEDRLCKTKGAAQANDTGAPLASFSFPYPKVIPGEISYAQLSISKRYGRLIFRQNLVRPMFHRLHTPHSSADLRQRTRVLSPSFLDRDLVACQISDHQLLNSLRYGRFHPTFASTPCQPTFLSHCLIMGNPRLRKGSRQSFNNKLW